MLVRKCSDGPLPPRFGFFVGLNNHLVLELIDLLVKVLLNILFLALATQLIHSFDLTGGKHVSMGIATISEFLGYLPRHNISLRLKKTGISELDTVLVNLSLKTL